MSKLRSFVQQVYEMMGGESLPIAPPLESAVMGTTKKSEVLEAILRRGHEVGVDDLPTIMDEMMNYFAEYQNGDYLTDFSSDDYFRLLDLSEDTQARVVVVGDIHCDFNALAALLLKLMVSPFDYFEKAYFVFLGDYLDRGTALFEPLLLLMDLKRILGGRLIMLRGNHELIAYDGEKQELVSHVLPQQSCSCLNEFCGLNKSFLKAFGDFYSNLPTYVYLRLASQNILLTHAAIPRMLYFDAFYYDKSTGSIEFDEAFLKDQRRLAEEQTTDDSLTSMKLCLNSILLGYRNKILYDMIWGDPSHEKEKFQVSGRFEFGRVQFEPYAQKNSIARVFRSHEPQVDGFESFYDDSLYTIFSTGGRLNDQTGYIDVDPAFAIIKADGTYMIENSFDYKVVTREVIHTFNNLFSGQFLNTKQMVHLSLNDEFVCTEIMAVRIESILEKIKQGFKVSENQEDDHGIEE